MNKIRSYGTIIQLIVLLGFLSTSDCLADSVLSVPEKIQEHSLWCWAGSSQAVLAYYKGEQYPSQCRIANWAWGRTDCCGNSVFKWKSGCNQSNYMYGTDGSLKSVLENWGVLSNSLDTYLDQTTATAELDAGRPFVMRFGWTSGGGHFLVGRGINGNNLYYMDPWPGNGYTISSYDWVVSSSNHSWTHTLQITTGYVQPQVNVIATDGAAGEGGSDKGVFKVSRPGSNTDSPLTVDYTVSGTATGGDDYDQLAGSVTIPAGRSSANIRVIPKDDTSYEGTESVIVTLSADSAYTVGSPYSAKVKINDNDPKDNYEPDNLPWAAKTIVSGETQKRSLHKALDVDWVKFTLDETSEVTIAAGGVAGGEAVIILFGPNSPITPITRAKLNSARKSLVIQRSGPLALEPGTYYIRVAKSVKNTGVLPYTLSFKAQSLL